MHTYAKSRDFVKKIIRKQNNFLNSDVHPVLRFNWTQRTGEKQSKRRHIIRLNRDKTGVSQPEPSENPRLDREKPYPDKTGAFQPKMPENSRFFGGFFRYNRKISARFRLKYSVFSGSDAHPCSTVHFGQKIDFFLTFHHLVLKIHAW